MVTFLAEKKSNEQTDVPELSIIVPVLNEVEQLPAFVADIRSQRDICFELIISDGGSVDGSLDWVREQADIADSIVLVTGSKGRGRQLNRGLAKARGDWLLLLHVDSRFTDPQALRNSMDYLKQRGQRVAGHFALNFRDTQNKYAAAYDFYQRKARLGLPETIHGDQGFLLHRSLADKLGGFREDLPVMEDTDYAERLRQLAQWQLLPAEISTSARRFSVEGLWQRQTLGALLMCFRHIGWHDFFEQAPAIYRQQSQTDQLQLLPFFDLIIQRLEVLPRHERRRLWLATGTYVQRHAWQVVFAMDARRARRQGRPLSVTPTSRMNFLMPPFNLLTDNPVGHAITAGLVRGWFSVMRGWLCRSEKIR
jgi:rSAM/selenodomain-associated transferase 2